ncbi:MAG: excinuclease ABC subunit UvrB [Candidatus Eisenbacteria sp.]|nr:excinuclease ABC subunit UvrB [Candidatus Eisenbacteria bacterium]
MEFQLTAPYPPAGDQPKAVEALVEGVRADLRYQMLLGVTGSGKTFTMANVIRAVGKPTLIISHNKTLAAQLYGEFRGYFASNAVEYFVSYYDYYQPEAYLPATDTYIDKDASINEDLERLRLRTTASILERRDVVIISSVSCIYGLGSPEDFKNLMLLISRGERWRRDTLLHRLVNLQYLRNDVSFEANTFRVRGDTIEIRLGYNEAACRIELFGDEVERLSSIDPLTGKVHEVMDRLAIYPAKHFVTPPERLKQAVVTIREELMERLVELRSENKELEARRLESRTRYDLEMLQEVGYCRGIENYSRHLSGRAPGEPPWTLIDYMGDDFLTIIDESHVSLPQIRGMHAGDHSRKLTLVEHGFRLPSALDNRPLRIDEFMEKVGQIVFVSATPGDYELEATKGVVVEQIIRPTGLVDPEVIVRPARGQVDDLLHEVRERVGRNERVLVTTLTKKMAEDLSEYFAGMGVRVRYLHSDIDTIERIAILRGLRLAEFDVLVGINLLREGLDLPEVSLVAILDADKEGFLRSDKSIIQTAGRAARNVAGLVLLYADSVTGSMARALEETTRRRTIQLDYNRKHNLTPVSIIKSVDEVLRATAVADSGRGTGPEEVHVDPSGLSREELIRRLWSEMNDAAEAMEFEKAASLRDRLFELEVQLPERRSGGRRKHR